MAVSIRLRRMGGSRDPFYHVVAADRRFATGGRYTEKLGWYDPKKKGQNFEIKADRVEHWLKQGAAISPSVKSMLLKARRKARQQPEAQAQA